MAQSGDRTRTHLIEFNGATVETTVTYEAKAAENWIKNVYKLLKHENGGNGIVGMDCKYIRHPINSLSGKISLLQLCVGDKCLVLQLLYMDGIPRLMRDFLKDPDLTFVGVEIQEKSRKLMNEYELDVGRKVDLWFLAKAWFPIGYKESPSLKVMAYRIGGISMRKSRGNDGMFGDLESRVLDMELVEQVCVDACASYVIAHKLFRYG